MKSCREATYPWEDDSVQSASWGDQSWSFSDFYSYSHSGDGSFLTRSNLTLRDETFIAYERELPFTGYDCQLAKRQPCSQFYAPTTVTCPNILPIRFTYYPTAFSIRTPGSPTDNFQYGVRPEKRCGHTQVYAYVQNSSGTLVAAASPVWMPSRVSECRTTASCANGATNR